MSAPCGPRSSAQPPSAPSGDPPAPSPPPPAPLRSPPPETPPPPPPPEEPEISNPGTAPVPAPGTALTLASAAGEPGTAQPGTDSSKHRRGKRASKLQFLPFDEALALAQSLRLATSKEWYAWSRSGSRPTNVPSNPANIYKDTGWQDWPHWLQSGGKGRGKYDRKGTGNGKGKRKAKGAGAGADAAGASAAGIRRIHTEQMLDIARRSLLACEYADASKALGALYSRVAELHRRLSVVPRVNKHTRAAEGAQNEGGGSGVAGEADGEADGEAGGEAGGGRSGVAGEAVSAVEGANQDAPVMSSARQKGEEMIQAIYLYGIEVPPGSARQRLPTHARTQRHTHTHACARALVHSPSITPAPPTLTSNPHPTHLLLATGSLRSKVQKQSALAGRDKKRCAGNVERIFKLLESRTPKEVHPVICTEHALFLAQHGAAQQTSTPGGLALSGIDEAYTLLNSVLMAQYTQDARLHGYACPGLPCVRGVHVCASAAAAAVVAFVVCVCVCVCVVRECCWYLVRTAAHTIDARLGALVHSRGCSYAGMFGATLAEGYNLTSKHAVAKTRLKEAREHLKLYVELESGPYDDVFVHTYTRLLEATCSDDVRAFFAAPPCAARDRRRGQAQRC